MARSGNTIAHWLSEDQIKTLGLTLPVQASATNGRSGEDLGDKVDRKNGKLWSVNVETAPEAWRSEQLRLAKLCVADDRMESWHIGKKNDIQGLEKIAGVDVSFFPDGLHAVVAVVVLSFPALEVLYERCVTLRLTMPYVPGYLAFREAPACAALLVSLPLSVRPQAVFVDGNGVFHPRRCGCATHLGVSIGIPTIGVAKTIHEVGDMSVENVRVVSRHLKNVGDWAPVRVDGEPLAAVLWPCWEAEAPLVVSVGHLVSLRTAATLTAAVCKQEVAEPVRQADLLGRAAVKKWLHGEPLADLCILQARTHRKGVEPSVLPVIRNLLAKQAAEKLGEGWMPVESKRQQRRQRQQAHTVESDALLCVPGVIKVTLPDSQLAKDRSRKMAAAGKVSRKVRFPESKTAKTLGSNDQLDFALGDLEDFPRLILLCSGNLASSLEVACKPWPIQSSVPSLTEVVIEGAPSCEALQKATEQESISAETGGVGNAQLYFALNDSWDFPSSNGTYLPYPENQHSDSAEYKSFPFSSTGSPSSLRGPETTDVVGYMKVSDTLSSTASGSDYESLSSNSTIDDVPLSWESLA